MKPSERIREIRDKRKESEDFDDIDNLFGHESKLVKAIIQYLDESQEPKALEEKPCCVAELGCLCPGENGMSEHDTEKCPCPEHYAKHEEWLRHLISMAKPQEAYGFLDHTHCPEKDSPCGIEGIHSCCLCEAKPHVKGIKDCQTLEEAQALAKEMSNIPKLKAFIRSLLKH